MKPGPFPCIIHANKRTDSEAFKAMKSIVANRQRFPLNTLYDEAGLNASARRSLNLMLTANLCGNLFGIICGSGTTAMISLANALHAGDLAFGLINGIPQAAMLLQIPFAMLVSRTHKRKRYLLTFGLFSRFLWVLFGLIPAMASRTSAHVPMTVLIALLAISSCCSAAINVCWLPWFSDIAPSRIRGRWLSFRDALIACFNFGFGLLVARLLDVMSAETRYPVIFLIGGLMGMMDMLCFAFCEERYNGEPVVMHLKSSFREVLNHKPFMLLTLMWTAWCFTANLCDPYLSRYSVNMMGLNFTQLMLCSTATVSLTTIIVSRFWGRALYAHGSRRVMLISTLGATLANLFYLFSYPGGLWPVLLRNAVGSAFWCGSNLTCLNMQLDTSPDESRSIYVAVISCVTSLVGVSLGSLVGGALLEHMESVGWFAGSFDRYKALIAFAATLRLLAVAVFVPRLSAETRD